MYVFEITYVQRVCLKQVCIAHCICFFLFLCDIYLCALHGTSEWVLV